MMHARRWKLSAAQRADMWNRWKAGQSLQAIGRALAKDQVVIQFLLRVTAGLFRRLVAVRGGNSRSWQFEYGSPELSLRPADIEFDEG